MNFSYYDDFRATKDSIIFTIYYVLIFILFDRRFVDTSRLDNRGNHLEVEYYKFERVPTYFQMFRRHNKY